MPTYKQPSALDYQEAVKQLQQGHLIAYPTEAVYGFGCDPLNQAAVARLNKLKQRPDSKGFILIAANWQQLENYIAPLTQQQLAQAMSVWPGPFTWLMPAAADAPEYLHVNQLIAVRITNHPIAKRLCETAQQCLISTSANLANQPPLTSAAAVSEQFGQAIDFILGGDVGDLPRPTPIRELLSLNWIRYGETNDS